MTENVKVSKQDIAKVNRYKWVVWLILAIMYIFVSFHRMAVGVLQSDLGRDFGIGSTEFATISSMYTWAYFFMQIPSGILADKIGPKKTVTYFTILSVVGSIIFGLAKSVWVAYFARFLVGIGVSVVFICLIKIQSKWFSKTKAAFMVGMVGIASNIGSVIAQAPLVIISEKIGWRLTFIILGVIMGIFGLLTLLFVKDEPSDLGLPSIDEIENNPPVPKTELQVGQALKSILSNPKTWTVSLTFAGLYTGFMILLGLYGSQFITLKYGLSQIAAGNTISVSIIGITLAGLIVGSLSDRFDKRKIPFVFSTAVALLCWIVFTSIQMPIWVLMPFMFVFGVAINGFTLAWTIGGELNNPKYTGMVTGVVNSVGYLAAAIVPTIMGMIIDSNEGNQLVGLQKAFLVIIVMMVVSFIASLTVKETHAKNIYQEER